MKSILLTVTPEILVNILNGKTSILIRKLFPKDYIGWVYLYCSKSNTQYLVGSKTQKCELLTKSANARFNPNIDKYTGNGKVVARFWCDKIEELIYGEDFGYPRTETLDSYDITAMSAIWNCDIQKYLKGKNGLVIYISKLEIFDEPKELKYFYYNKLFHRSEPDEDGRKTFKALMQLYKAPTNYCWVEVE